MMDKAYEAKKYEDDIYKKWEESGVFTADVNSDKESFTISMPPPNATGVLHLGHAAFLTIEDIMIRHRRMKGFEALWLPGTDHAAIATESVVIKNLKNEQGIKNPRSLGREGLVDEIKKYVEKSQGTIRSQIRKMGASCDWSREGYTMDESLNRCVNEVFKKMYDDGLIYRGERVVNWDVALQTTLADDEVEYEEKEGTLYTFEYLSAEQTGGDPMYVATSRPETKLGDTALAIHPDDTRFGHLVGKTFDVEWPHGRKIKVTVIADREVDPEFGTGVVGVTPFHSKVDYDLWQRHKDIIQSYPIQVIGEDGFIMETIDGYAGLSVEEARNKFIEGLKNDGRLKLEEKYAQQLSISYRSKMPVEPLPKLQWFIDVNKRFKIENSKLKLSKSEMTLKEIMQEVVKNHQIRIIPERFEKTYFHWIDNLQDWCISRQIWWGHQVPVWYKDEEVYVGIESPKGNEWIRDEDTLDTWFSSALWTWSTLIDPKVAADTSLSLNDLLEKSPDFNKFHPTSVMETGYDILFFWVARMILMTTYATGEIPFETVYLHGLIRTRDGSKMSKSKPETCIDPLDMIDKYGTDALRMSVVTGSTPGNDMRLYEEKIQGYRNFTNKLWNASRFVLGILEEKSIKDEPKIDYEKLSDADEWILGKLNDTIQFADKGLMEYRIGEVGQALYDFLWNDFCDWYLELSKGEKQNPAVLYYVLKNILILLHPIIPFSTEVIWGEMPGQNEMLIGQKYSEIGGKKYNIDSTSLIIDVITKIRHLRSENKIEPIQKIPVTIYGNKSINILERGSEDIIRLARISDLTLKGSGEKLANAATDIVNGIEIFVPLDGLVDTEKEKARLEKEISNLSGYIKGLEAKLSNDNFVKNAPKEVVDGEKSKLDEAKDKVEKMTEQLNNL
ncbi:valine--tRNA ligase [Candidatus Peregrinibacteria bacterium]|nr:valine--tRNA ligase [Candidatus Peregrinibacteria bacterium]